MRLIVQNEDTCNKWIAKFDSGWHDRNAGIVNIVWPVGLRARRALIAVLHDGVVVTFLATPAALLL